MRECAKNRFTIISSRDYPDIKYFVEDNNISKRIFTSYYMEKKILVEGSFRRKGLNIEKGEKVEFLLEDEKNIIVREKMKLDIIFEDDDILLVNKPVAMSVHPTRYEQVGTLFNGVSQYFYEKNLDRKIRVVNRLDRNTSGLVLFAKSQIVDYRLSEQFKNRQVVKKYMALVEGHIDSEGCIEEPILHNEGSKKRVDPRGKYALTKYKRLGEYRDFSLIDIEIPTGRSHQIRVHLSYLGHPLVGDSLYGSKIESNSSYFLHSYYMKINHPRTGEVLEVETDLPREFKKLILN